MQFPDIVREIIRRGHSVENHTARHPVCFAWYAPQTLLREINDAQATLAGITGCTPRFFRAPFGLRSPLLDAVLVRTALRYVSWTSRGFDMVSRKPSRVLKRLSCRLAPGAIVLLHDRHAIGSSARDPIVLEVLPQLLQQLKDRGLRSVSLPVGIGDGSVP
jgi:peptidoglycan/xylan/chitin deacetylase (PgdA/CDA1 family)